MKKLIFLLLTILLIVGTACSSGGETAVTNTASTNTDQAARLNDTYSDALPIMVQLAAGTLKLDQTDLAVDETLAAEILPLWQAAQSLSASDTAASVEVNAVLNQIQDAMSPEQIVAIADMALTADSLTELLESGAISFGRGLGQGPNSDSAADGGFTPPAGFGPGVGGGLGGGDFGGGGFGGPGAGGFGAGADLSEDDIATRQAEFASGEGFADIQNQAMVGAVIRLLQTKTGVEPELPQGGPQAGIGEAIMTAVAETLNLTAEELQTELTESGSVLAVVEAHGGDVTAVREAIIANLNALPNAADLDVEQIANDWLGQ